MFPLALFARRLVLQHKYFILHVLILPTHVLFNHVLPCIEGGYSNCSVDGIFGLCRKKSAGTSVRSPLFSGVFFEDQEDVDMFVASYDAADGIMDKVSCKVSHVQSLIPSRAVMSS